MAGNGYFVVVTPSKEVRPGQLALDGDSLAKARLAEGTPVELTANGKKLALVVQRGAGGAAGINAREAESIGIGAESLARMRRIRPHELRRLRLKVVTSDVEISPVQLRSALALRPASRGSTLLLNVGGREVEVYVEDCEPGEGIVSYNTVIQLV